MVSGAIRGNGGGGVRTERGTFTMLGGFVEGREIQWTLATINEEMPSYMSSVAYGNGRFIAMMRPEGFEKWPIPPMQKMLYSTDGITWTVKDTEVSGRLSFSNGRFFASGGELSSSLATSTDGENWTTVVNTQGQINGPVYGNGRWVFVTRYYSGVGGNIMYSTDGVTWTAANVPTRIDFNAVAYGSGKFIAMDRDGRMAYSADGVTWTVPSGTYGNGVRAIAYGNGKFVKIGWDHSSYSEDGLSWTFVDFFGLGNGVATHIVYDGRKFVAVDYDGRMATSADGVTWKAEEFDIFGGSRIFQLNGIAYGAGRFVVMEDTDDGSGKSPTAPGRIAYSNVQE